jgi:3-oxoacyl-(acyl-carrier-protein) synthase
VAEPVAITGMAVNTVLGDTLDGFFAALLAGRSGITRWRSLDTERIYSKIGGDLGGYDTGRKRDALAGGPAKDQTQCLRRLGSTLPWSTQLAALVAIDACAHAGLLGSLGARAALFVAGHNFLNRYHFTNAVQFLDEPDYIAAAYGLHSLDSHQASVIAQVIGIQGTIATVGAACASGNLALRQAMHELRSGEADVALVVGGPIDYSPLDLHAMAMLGAISFRSFNDAPAQASRPFDTKREGFVPAHAAAALVIERSADARARGATVHASLLSVAAGSDANAALDPSVQGQTAVIRRALAAAGVAPDAIDYVNAHATSTPDGDRSEAAALAEVFGARPRLMVNATKSMLGHAVWSSALVETVATVLQMNAGKLHPSINVETLDPAMTLDLCRETVEWPAKLALKTAFGFGGINSASVIARGAP